MITSNNTTQTGAEQYVAEASELGWAPGYVPQEIETALGNGLLFILVNYTNDCFNYKQQCGAVTLTVYND